MVVFPVTIVVVGAVLPPQVVAAPVWAPAKAPADEVPDEPTEYHIHEFAVPGVPNTPSAGYNAGVKADPVYEQAVGVAEAQPEA